MDNEIDRKIDVTAILFLLVQNRQQTHGWTLIGSDANGLTYRTDECINFIFSCSTRSGKGKKFIEEKRGSVLDLYLAFQIGRIVVNVLLLYTLLSTYQSRLITNTIININPDTTQSVFSGIGLTRYNSIRNSRFTPIP